MNDTVTVFSSLKDLGYQQAKTGDSLSEQAAYAISKIVGFPTDISPEARAELCAGYQMRYRAAAFFGRLYAPEITMGMHSTEEVIDIQHEEPKAVAAINEAIKK